MKTGVLQISTKSKLDVPTQHPKTINSKRSRIFEQRSEHLFHGYTTEFREALETNNELQLYEIFSASNWKRHLEGYRLEKDTLIGKNRVVGTPLVDLIQRFPLFAGKVFYKMMLVESKVSPTADTDHTPFDEFELSIINQATTVRLGLFKTQPQSLSFPELLKGCCFYSSTYFVSSDSRDILYRMILLT